MTKTKRPWLKRLLITGLVLIGIATAIYWYVATEKFADTKDIKAAFTANAIDFIREFEKDDKAANKKYADKIVIVNGMVSEVEAADTTMNIKFIDATSGSFVIFAFQQQHLAEAKTIKVDDTVSIKGYCSGATYSDILGVKKIDFQRSTLNK